MTVEPSEEPSLCRSEDHSSDEETEEIDEAVEISEIEDDSDEKPLETALTEFYAD